jgi:hypothetical protein
LSLRRLLLAVAGSDIIRSITTFKSISERPGPGQVPVIVLVKYEVRKLVSGIEAPISI